MLPIYVSYFVGDSGEKSRGFLRALCFVLGFTVTFSLLGLFAGALGAAMRQHQTAVNLITGGIVILFGLSYLGLIRLPFFKGMERGQSTKSALAAFLFGIVYSVSLTPCIGAFLGSALMMAANYATAGRGLLLLLTYSMGMGLPFLLSAMLIDQLRGAFQRIKAHYKTINTVCGVFLILVGVFMACGWLNRLLALFS